MRISLTALEKVFSSDLQGKYCIEILFSVNGNDTYKHCWMGKTSDENIAASNVYWFGLTPDGTQAHDFASFDDMVHSAVFNGASLTDIIDLIEIVEIDGCNPQTRIEYYLSKYVKT